MNARLIIEAYHRGPWRAIWALLIHEIQDVWDEVCWPRWEWFRVHVLRRAPDPEVAAFARELEEDRALTELAKQL